MRWLPVFFLFAWLSSVPTIYAAALESAHFPSLVSSLRIDIPFEFCGEPVPVKSQEIRERLEKELLLSLWDRPQVILWLKRSSRYLPHIEQLLQENEMPDDLKYLAVAESALRAHAGSRKGAIGFWQFMEATGLKYGLVINGYCDERRNLFASTAAAIRYFRELYQISNSWTLAAAAYNMGEEGLMAEILEQDTADYYKLHLPLETQRYIFRILSVKLILSNPEKYGFKLANNDYYPPLTFDEIQVDCVDEIPLRIIARAGKTHFKAIKDLNPEIRGHYLAKGKHAVLLPPGASVGFQARYESLVEEYLEARKKKVYIVKKGDNLSSIAQRSGIPLAALIIWNRIDLQHPIHPGDRLIIYGNEVELHEPDTDEQKDEPGLN
jgi:membrane-bound lytic murein transglycosylase D